MHIYRDLYLGGEEANIVRFLTKLGDYLPQQWRRDREAEDWVNPGALGGQYYCFTVKKSNQLEQGSVFFYSLSENKFEVTNIVPSKDKQQLSTAEYNAILTDFTEHLPRPLAEKYNVTIELTEANVDITHWITKDAAEKLQGFSRAANKSTGSSHPADERRWFAFIVATHLDGSKLPVDMLHRWLTDEHKWDEETAHKLTSQYEYARSLLSFYDKQITEFKWLQH